MDGFSCTAKIVTDPKETRTIKLLRPVVVKDAPGVAVGDVFPVPARLAHDLVIEGLAEYANAETLKTEMLKSEKVQKRKPAIENRDPVAE